MTYFQYAVSQYPNSTQLWTGIHIMNLLEKKKRENNSIETIFLLPPLKSNSVIKEYPTFKWVLYNILRNSLFVQSAGRGSIWHKYKLTLVDLFVNLSYFYILYLLICLLTCLCLHVLVILFLFWAYQQF